MKTRELALVLCVVALGSSLPRLVEARPLLAQTSSGDAKPSKTESRTVTLHGTVEAVDKEKGTVTLKGAKGRTMTLAVQDRQKLDAVKVGDPVIAKYYESLAIQVRKAGQGTPGAAAQEAVVGSKPGETPAGAVGRQVTVTATITAIDTKARTVTIKGPEGNVETVKVRDPKNLVGVKVGDLVELTYTQALAIAIDKPASK